MTIRVAILGSEHYHANFWTKAFLQSPDAAISGLWDSDAHRAAVFSAQYGLAVEPDLDRLILGSDAVAICSATGDHLSLVKAAAAHRRPVLCEKPLGTSMVDCLQIQEIVDASGIPFMQSFPKRFDPINSEIAALLREKAIGQVSLCRIRHSHSHGLNGAFRTAWFTDPARSGGGTLLDEGIHAADFLRWMFGEPTSVFATVSSRTLGLGVEDTAVATFRYDNMIAEVATGWCFAAADTSIEIYGTDGTILLSGVDIASRSTRERDFLRVFRRRGEAGDWTSSPTTPHFTTGVFHEHVAWAFVKALKEDVAMPVTLDDGLRAFAMIEAAYRSVASGRAEPVVTSGKRS
ncbi:MULTISPECIES: Gfo/Idh/MocA family oxidoreductase [unclassified Chelatococcus]|uniref:Gfo/Idh/MocA family protein n=1 Tax=unclassified Chelatococcus TaxID=2638111 RepID=UPI001BCF8D2B|nr:MULTISPECIES: Gfo/Idh/MocA family oxidoreductase [unclassified Chelatococcus]MBS7695994.1 Gfo/Idh/MocA family oxidoreductase [Chelatococcus sp. YT9]MBX3555631.1 Gfo/Idh/MocA family oxidoreductase [Chelatococcus sp.]